MRFRIIAWLSVVLLAVFGLLGCSLFPKPKGKLPPSKFTKEEWKLINHSDWPMFHHDVLHTGFNPKEKKLKPPLKVKWKKSHTSAGYEAPAVVNGVIYTYGGRRVEAIDAEAGKRIWKFLAQAPILSSPCIYKDTVYIGSNDHNLYALDAKTGEKKWSYEASSWIESSPIVKERLFLVN